jgi:hypothetical protein
MTREVDLVSYLPPFLAEFKEIAVTLEAENPEFVLVWNAAERVLQNEFIETADEYGISRFEKILNILPSTEDTLESRRARVQARWFNTIPYTMKSFLAKLIALCGDSNFTVTKEYEKYKVEILTNLELFGQVEELERIIDSMIPCNMIVISLNEIPCGAAGFAFIAGGVCSVEHFFITNDEQTKHTISNETTVKGGVIHTAHYFITNDERNSYSIDGKAAFRGGTVNTADYLITNDSKESIAVSGSALHGGGAVNSVSVVITNDFNEQFNISGENSVGSGVVASEFIEIKQ